MLIPRDVFEQHIIALGKTRSGKSSAMRLLVEDLLDHNKPVTIVDPKGDWWGLKASASGKKAGYPVVIFGGEHADVPLNARSGAAVAELLATGNRSAIIDLGGWMPGDRTQFWIDFASTYFRTHRGRRWLVIDEVHNFCFKGKVMSPDAGKMLHWSNRLASEGLGKGISMLAASQRPQKVHNDFLTSCETLIAMRVIHKADRQAYRDWIDGCGDEEQGKELIATVASMKRGEAWVWSPEIGFGPKRLKFPMFKTYDSFKAQGTREIKLSGWAEVNLEDVRKKLEAAVKEAEANDPNKLRQRIKALEVELTRKRPAPKAEVHRVEVPDRKAASAAERIAKEVKAEYNRARAVVEAAMRILVKVQAFGFEGSSLKPEEIEQALKVAAREVAKAAKLSVERRDKEFTALKAEVGKLLGQMKRFLSTEEVELNIAVQRNEPVTARSIPTPRPHPVYAQVDRPGDKGLPKGERAILIAAAQSGVAARDQLTVLTGYKRSSRDAYISRLRDKGFVEQDGDGILATQEGIAALGNDYQPLPTGDDLRAYWLERLPQGERVVLQILVDAYSKAVTRDQISEATNYQRSSRDAYLQRLKARRLVEFVGRGQVKAADELFG